MATRQMSSLIQKVPSEISDIIRSLSTIAEGPTVNLDNTFTRATLDGEFIYKTSLFMEFVKCCGRSRPEVLDRTGQGGILFGRRRIRLPLTLAMRQDFRGVDSGDLGKIGVMSNLAGCRVEGRGENFVLMSVCALC